MTVCMLCMCAMYLGIMFFLKASSKGIFAALNSGVPVQPHRQRAHKKAERERNIQTGG